MRAFGLSLGLLSAFPAIGAEAPPAAALAQESALEPLLPLKIPGYELRVLDIPKPVVFVVGGTRVEASLPVFFYLPDADQRRAIGLIQQAYDELGHLGGKEEWSGEELHRVLGQLEQALRAFQSTFAPVPHPPGADSGRP